MINEDLNIIRTLLDIKDLNIKDLLIIILCNEDEGIITRTEKKTSTYDSTSLGPIYLRDLYSYGVLRTIVLVLETPLANKLFVNTRCQPWRPAAWPVPSPVA